MLGWHPCTPFLLKVILIFTNGTVSSFFLTPFDFLAHIEFTLAFYLQWVIDTWPKNILPMMIWLLSDIQPMHWDYCVTEPLIFIWYDIYFFKKHERVVIQSSKLRDLECPVPNIFFYFWNSIKAEYFSNFYVVAGSSPWGRMNVLILILKLVFILQRPCKPFFFLLFLAMKPPNLQITSRSQDGSGMSSIFI